MSEIDQIFASKGKAIAKALDPPPSDNTKEEKKKKKKHKDTPFQPILDLPGDSPSSEHRKRPPPETVVDSSSDIVQPKRSKIARAAKFRSNRPDRQDDDETKFKDSRGSTARRTTEEGWLIYKEDELGIRDGGGDTPLCPFDCDCCF